LPKAARAFLARSTRWGSLDAGSSPVQETPRSLERSEPFPRRRRSVIEAMASLSRESSLRVR